MVKNLVTVTYIYWITRINYISPYLESQIFPLVTFFCFNFVYRMNLAKLTYDLINSKDVKRWLGT